MLNTNDLITKNMQTVTIPQAAFIQLRRRSPEDEQDDRAKYIAVLINVNK